MPITHATRYGLGHLADAGLGIPDLPFLAEALAVQAAQCEYRANWRQPNALSGLGLEPPVVEDVEVIRQRLVQGAEDRRRFRASPRGRFLSVVEEMEDLGCYPEEATALRTLSKHFYDSGFGRPGEPLRLDTVARAIRILNGIGTAEARKGIAALVDLLDGQAPAKVAA